MYDGGGMACHEGAAPGIWLSAFERPRLTYHLSSLSVSVIILAWVATRGGPMEHTIKNLIDLFEGGQLRRDMCKDAALGGNAVALAHRIDKPEQPSGACDVISRRIDANHRVA